MQAEGVARGNQPLQIGFHLALPSEYQGDLSTLMEWTPLADGSIVSAVSVTSPEAAALRAGIQAELGSGGEIRFFGGGPSMKEGSPGRAGREFPVMTRADFREAGGTETVWSPIVEGNTIGIEVTLPSRDALSDFSFRIEKVSHIYTPMGQRGPVPKQLQCTNHVDVQCRSRIVGDRQAAVGRIMFEVGEFTGLCSGTLLNDTRDGGFIPYFLTAHHCVSSATVARSVEARWFYQRASCGSERLDARDETTHGGTVLLATSAAQDSTLLRFRRSLPGGLTYSGWSADPLNLPTQVYGIHHPDGDVKKYAGGRATGREDFTTCDDPENQVGCQTVREAIVVPWSDGTTEGGSSGSGLFDGENLIGVLSGGGGTCAQTTDGYGPFQHFYPRIRRWLSPDPYSLPFVTAASNRSRPGFVRLINHSERAGTVTIRAIDDTGERFGPVSLRLDAQAAVHLTSSDLENGNAEKGLSAGVGDGTGNWRLELSSLLAIEALAYIRTPDGFVTSMHEVAAATDEESNRYHVPFVNPGSNVNQQSLLRVINPGSGTANIVITGVDDAGDAAPLGEVSLTLAAGAARMLSARDLEQGGDGFSGRLGDGAGKWRLSVSGDRPLQVMSLLQLPTGHLANLSRGRDGVAVWVPPPPSDKPDLVVQSPSVSDSSPNAGQSFTLRATVRNSGAVRSAATTLRYYRSSDATISTSDPAVGTDPVSALAASGTSAESISLTAPSSAGTYYYGACVDTVSEESNTANNCSSAVAVTVSGGGSTTYGVGDALPGVSSSTIPSIVGGGSISSAGGVTTITLNNGAFIQLRDGTRYTCRASGGCTIRNGVVSRGTIVGGGGTPPPNAPDLVVTNFSVSDTSLNVGQAVSARATVRNQGNARSAATTLRWLTSADATISTTDEEEGTSSIGGIAPSGSSNRSFSTTVSLDTPPGTYYAGACVDAVPGETNTRNNCSNAVRVTVLGGGARRFGAIAFDFHVSQSCPGLAAGIAVNHGSSQAALDAARRACQSDGGSVANCRSNSESFQGCAAMAYGTNPPLCGVQASSGSTRSAAESAARSRCSARGLRGCRIWVNGSGQRISACNSSSNSNASMEKSRPLMELMKSNR